MNKLHTYIRQRFNVWQFSGLSVLVFTLVKQDKIFGAYEALQLTGIFLFLFCMRLYDDLQNAGHDAGKSGRDYTLAENSIPLYRSLFVFVLICILSQWRIPENMLFMSVFFVINHLLYRLFAGSKEGRFVLPLLKYAFICALAGNWNFPAAVLMFTAMLVFDTGKDTNPPISKSLVYPGVLSVFVLLYLLGDPGFLIFPAAGLLISLAVFAYGLRNASYIFLINILLIRLIQLYL